MFQDSSSLARAYTKSTTEYFPSDAHVKLNILKLDFSLVRHTKTTTIAKERASMKILVINAGSSSLKYQLIDMTDESVIAKGNQNVSVSEDILHIPRLMEENMKPIVIFRPIPKRLRRLSRF